MKKKTMFAYLRNAVLVIALYALLSLLMSAGVIDRYYSGILTMMFINIIMAVSLNLTTGYLGQLVLGHAGFMSVGAFSAAIFTTTVHLPAAVSFPLALLIAGVVSAVVGIVIGIPALHLRGDYLAIITLGFGEIIRVIFLNLDITGGALGMRHSKSNDVCMGVFCGGHHDFYRDDICQIPPRKSGHCDPGGRDCGGSFRNQYHVLQDDGVCTRSSDCGCSGRPVRASYRRYQPNKV